MKKILLIVGAGLCIAVSAIVAMVLMANRVGDSVQSEFFAVVAAADPEMFFAAADPRMRDEIDAPLLRQWMQSLNERLGAYEGLEPTDFHSSTRFENGSRIVETAGTVRFENGTAYSELTYVNGKLAKFDVTSELMGDDWFRTPDDSTIYRVQAETFYTEIANRDFDAAYSVLSELHQRSLPIAEFEKLADKICAGIGQFEELNFVDEELLHYEQDGQRLVLRFMLVGSKASYDAEAVFAFDGLKAHFVEFNAAPIPPIREE